MAGLLAGLVSAAPRGGQALAQPHEEALLVRPLPLHRSAPPRPNRLFFFLLFSNGGGGSFFPQVENAWMTEGRGAPE